MILRCRLDEGMVRVMAGNQANSGLNELKVRLALVPGGLCHLYAARARA
jgi:hypothetical protein